jgi:hypothetical protein
MFSSPPPPKNFLQAVGFIALESKSRIICQSSNDENRLILFLVQTESIGEVTAVVVARIERKPVGLGVGDKF